jgi:hypothetical protein
MCLTQVQGPQLTAAGDVGMKGYKVISVLISLCINICRNMDMYITSTPNAKEEIVGGIAWVTGASNGSSFRPRDRHWSHVPPVDAPKQDQPPSRHPELTVDAQGCPGWETRLGRPEHRRFP